mmetsp:Transcript_4284/g.6594  ORF Transcript_4284/g.6594 Transcript_4284/m.6594 type:complete len:158 (-) Transcript_4284:215-688(-)
MDEKLCRWLAVLVLVFFANERVYARDGFDPAERPARSAHPMCPQDMKYYRLREGAVVTCICQVSSLVHPIYGSNPYTDDSHVCTAATHSGLYRKLDESRVLVSVVVGSRRTSFLGSTQHGITSVTWRHPWPGSIQLLAPDEQRSTDAEKIRGSRPRT